MVNSSDFSIAQTSTSQKVICIITITKHTYTSHHPTLLTKRKAHLPTAKFSESIEKLRDFTNALNSSLLTILHLDTKWKVHFTLLTCLLWALKPKAKVTLTLLLQTILFGQIYPLIKIRFFLFWCVQIKL
jgi:hypothetical protein